MNKCIVIFQANEINVMWVLNWNMFLKLRWRKRLSTEYHWSEGHYRMKRHTCVLSIICPNNQRWGQREIYNNSKEKAHETWISSWKDSSHIWTPTELKLTKKNTIIRESVSHPFLINNINQNSQTQVCHISPFPPHPSSHSMLTEALQLLKV